MKKRLQDDRFKPNILLIMLNVNVLKVASEKQRFSK